MAKGARPIVYPISVVCLYVCMYVCTGMYVGLSVRVVFSETTAHISVEVGV